MQKLKPALYWWSPGNKISLLMSQIYEAFFLKAPAFKVPLCVSLKARPRNCFFTGKILIVLRLHKWVTELLLAFAMPVNPN